MKHFAARALRKVARIIDSEQQILLTDQSDSTTDWLSFANAGMLERGNHYCFDYVMRNLPSDAPMLEIGSFCGLSTNFITYYKKKHNIKNRLFNCDRWEFENTHKSSMLDDLGITHGEYRQFVKESYMRNVQMFSRVDLPYTIEMFSDEFFDAWRKAAHVSDVFDRPVTLGGALSFCYIDGNHSYEFARRDYENADEFLERGGFILFDDSADSSTWEVKRVIEEVKASGKYDVAAKNPNYLFVKR
ncbi:MAG TPA: class I SAM-dependent methyltransferase [Pyrinomonadaceae bacterium]|jgi:hypothetical protein